MTSRFVLVLLIAMILPSPLKAAGCIDGISEGAACSHIEFVGHLAPDEMNGDGEVLNDIWGWVDPGSNEEYAIVGMQDGTAFVRLAVDGAPIFLGRLPASDGQSTVSKAGTHTHGQKRCHDDLCGEEDSAWRDVKVFDHYAYIVSEATGHGVQIFDLHELQFLVGNAPDDTLPLAGYYGGVGHAHNIFINEDSARAYVVGHDGPGVAGGLHVLDLSDPINPVKLAELDADGYTHDVQCVTYSGPDADFANRELCFASNEDTLTVWDVTDPVNATIISRTDYDDAAYTHQGWLSPDQRYFYLNDELDEQRTGSRTHLRVFDVSDVATPRVVADYFAPTLAIDHNNYTHGRWLYQSNYAAGLRILDVLDPRHPVEAAFFDPQASDEPGFYGTWSNFLFPSGLVAFSDIRSGLFVVRPTLVENASQPDLLVSMTLDATTAERNAPVTGKLTVSNAVATDASDVLVTLHLPADAAFKDISEPSGWHCDGERQVHVVPCRIALLAAGAEANFEFSFAASAGGAVMAVGMAYSEEADAAPGDNLDTGTVTVQAAPPPASGTSSGGGSALWMLFAVFAVSSGLRRRYVRR